MTSRPKLSAKSVSPYLFAAVEQGLGSLLNLGVNIALVRVLAPHEYGAFVFWANTGFVLASVQNAVSASHLYVLSPGPGLAEHRHRVETLMHAVTGIWLVAVFALAMVGGLLIGRHDAHLSTSTGAVFLAAFLLQQYVRALAFSRGEPATAAFQTGLVLALSIAFLAIAIAIGESFHADLALGCLAGAYGAAGLVGIVRATWSQWRDWRWRDLGGYGAYLKNSGWIFLGVTTTELLTRFYTFIVAAWFGAAALAGLSATQLLLRPIPLAATSWSMVARGELAKRRDAENYVGMGRLSGLAVAGGLILTLGWTFLVYSGWGYISHDLFADKYADLGWMTLFWGISAGLSFAQVALSSSLQILRAFKTLALANTAAAAAAVGAILALMHWFGPSGAVLGNAVGQALEAVLMVWILGRTIGRLTREKADAKAQGL